MGLGWQVPPAGPQAIGGIETQGGSLKFQHFFVVHVVVTLLKTHMTLEKITIFNGKYIFIHGGFSNVMLVFRGVWGIFS